MAYRAVLTDAATAGRAELTRLWLDNLPVRGDADAKLRWTYVDAPAGKGEAFVLRADDGSAAGCAGIQRRELAYRGTSIRAALLADFAIDRRHRSGLPALTLQRAVKRHVETAYDLSYGFPNDQALAIHRRTGYHLLGRMSRFVRVLRHGGYLARRFGQPLAGRAIGAIVDPALMAGTALRAMREGAALELHWLDDVDARFDRLWAEASPSYPIACRRTAALLRWRFLRKPDQRYTVAALIDRRSDALRGYAIVQDGPSGGAELADLFGADPAAIDALLALLIRSLYDRGFTTVSIRYLGDPRLLPLLDHHRFSLRQSDRAVIVHPTASWPIHLDARRASAWYITELDEDT